MTQDQQALSALGAELQKKPQQAPSKDKVSDTDIDGLIGKALAYNRISSKQAEQYYMRLAQIESDLSAAEQNPSHLGTQLATSRQNLSSLRNELVHKVY